MSGGSSANIANVTPVRVQSSDHVRANQNVMSCLCHTSILWLDSNPGSRFSWPRLTGPSFLETLVILDETDTSPVRKRISIEESVSLATEGGSVRLNSQGHINAFNHYLRHFLLPPSLTATLLIDLSCPPLSFISCSRDFQPVRSLSSLFLLPCALLFIYSGSTPECHGRSTERPIAQSVVLLDPD